LNSASRTCSREATALGLRASTLTSVSRLFHIAGQRPHLDERLFKSLLSGLFLIGFQITPLAVMLDLVIE